MPNIDCICVLLCFIMQEWILIAKRQNQGRKDQKRARDWKDRKSRSQRSRNSQKGQSRAQEVKPDQARDKNKLKKPINHLNVQAQNP